MYGPTAEFNYATALRQSLRNAVRVITENFNLTVGQIVLVEIGDLFEEF